MDNIAEIFTRSSFHDGQSFDRSNVNNNHNKDDSNNRRGKTMKDQLIQFVQIGAESGIGLLVETTIRQGMIYGDSWKMVLTTTISLYDRGRRDWIPCLIFTRPEVHAGGLHVCASKMRKALSRWGTSHGWSALLSWSWRHVSPTAGQHVHAAS